MTAQVPLLFEGDVVEFVDAANVKKFVGRPFKVTKLGKSRGQLIAHLVGEDAERLTMDVRGLKKSAMPFADGPRLGLGEIVRWRKPRRPDHHGEFVVIALKAETYNLVKLGGDKNRYVRNVVSLDLEVVPIDQVVIRW